MRTDPRLQVKITVDLKNPTVPDILERLRQATGLTLTTSGNVEEDKPAFASLSFRNVPAWSVMQKLAESEVVAGRWERAGDGYRLVSDRPVAVTNKARPWLVHWLAGAAVLGAVVGSLAVTHYVRRKAKRAPPPGRPTGVVSRSP